MLTSPCRSWFNKISAHEAINVLTAARDGSFLFRPSSARKTRVVVVCGWLVFSLLRVAFALAARIAGFLSMSYNKEQVIHHVRIQVTSDGFICEGDEIVYTSLQALVDNKRAVLQHPIYAY